MTPAIQLFFTAVFGSLLAVVYFAGLWWTVRRLPNAANPVYLYVGSWITRLATVMAAFYLMIIYSDWAAIVICFAGFFAARLVIVRHLGHEPSDLSRERAQ